MDLQLKNKVIIVTGSTTGIGKAIAIRCVAEGAFVVIHGLEEGWGKEVMAEFNSIWRSQHISNTTKMSIIKTCVFSMALYACELQSSQAYRAVL